MSSLQIRSIAVNQEPDGERVVFATSDGNIDCRYYGGAHGGPLLVWLDACDSSQTDSIRRSLRKLTPDVSLLMMPVPSGAELAPMMLRIMLVNTWLNQRQFRGMVLVGHGRGAVAALKAGPMLPSIGGVVALAAEQGHVAVDPDISPIPLLLVHGEADSVVPFLSSLALHHQAGEPKRLLTYPGCMHYFDECGALLERDMRQWLREHLLTSPLE